MSVVTLAERRAAFYVTFDEACDAIANGHPEIAQRSLERALPKDEALVVHEMILLAHGAEPGRIGEVQ